jgi:Mn2+/Fe2+ NRAMP family transporter
MKKLKIVASSTQKGPVPSGPSFAIPARYAPMLFGLILSGLMSLLVSGIATFRAMGLVEDFPGQWTRAWLTAWVVAFPVVLVVAPLARRAVQRVVAKP